MANTTTKGATRTNAFERPEEYAGYTVLDPEGRRVGKAKVLYANANGEPEYVRVKVGFLGLRSVLLPVETLAVDEERRALVLE